MAVNDGVILIAIAIIVSILCYQKVSKLLGSLGIFLTGIGMMRYDLTESWTGLIVMAVGFIFAIDSLISKPSKNS